MHLFDKFRIIALRIKEDFQYIHIPYYFALFSFFLSFLIISAFQLTQELLWYDESGQFFIAKGLNHYSPPFALAQGLSEVLNNNSHYNMDPGGFSILLHFWSMISDNVIYLRFLPFCFFCGTLIIGYKIYSSVIEDKWFKLFGVIILLFYFVVENSIAELRAYCMESYFLLLSIYFTIKNNRKSPGKLKIFFLSLMLSCLCTARYSGIVSAFVISLYFIYIIIKFSSSKVWNLSIFCIPLLLTVCCIYIYEMSIQNSDASALAYVEYIYSTPSTLLSPMSISFYIQIILYIILHMSYKTSNELLTLLLIVSVFFFVLSSFNLYPWNMKRTMPCMITILLAIIISLANLFTRFNICSKFKFVLFLGICFFSVFLVYFDINKRKSPITVQIEEFVKFSKFPYEKMYIDEHNNPNIRYLFEYGFLKDKIVEWKYPKRYVFKIGKTHSAKKTFDSDSNINYSNSSCDYFFLSETPEINSGLKAVNGYKYIFHHE